MSLRPLRLRSSRSRAVNRLACDYLRRPSPDRLERVLATTRGWVVRLAQQVQQHCPYRPPTLEELAQAGAWGLVQALQGYQPQRDICFLTYARHRVRGAMVDWYREEHDRSRLLLHREIARHQAEDTLRDRLGRLPGTLELAQELGETAAVCRARERQRQAERRVSLADPLPGEDRDFQRQLTIADTLVGPADSDLEPLLEELGASLPVIQRLFLRLYHLHGWTLQEIGCFCSRSESWASITLAAIHANLRHRFAGREHELFS